MDPNTVLLSANLRQARFLRQKFPKIRHCFSLNEWLSENYAFCEAQGLENLPLLLTPLQRLILCRQAVQQIEGVLIDQTHCAQQATAAFQQLNQWGLNSFDTLTPLTEEQEWFQHWKKDYEARCTLENWLDPSCLMNFISGCFEKKYLSLPSEIQLYGFSEITPQQQHFFKTLERLSVKMTTCFNQCTEAEARRETYEQGPQELEAVVQWAYQKYKSNSNQRIAFIFPNLERDWQMIQRAFSKAFESETAVPYNISAGLALTSFPMVHLGLCLLALNPHHLEVHTLSLLLRTPFIAGAESERFERAHLDLKIRELDCPSLKFQDIFPIIKTQCPIFATHLARLLSDQTVKKATPNTWTSHFLKRLHAMGWPGERSLNSSEYQTWKRFIALFSELQTLNLLNESIDRHQALDILKTIGQQTLFQPQSHDTGIQILGILEASDLYFDQIRLVGFHSENWPPCAAPNPFIPIDIQQRHHMPHASAARELAFCQRLTDRFKHQCQQLIVSHPTMEGERHLQPSPLFSDLKEWTIPLKSIDAISNLNLEIKVDHPPKLLDFERAKLKGGTGLLKAQADCPFQAFARYRLKTSEPNHPRFGLEPAKRGQIIHDLLYHIWSQLHDQAHLIALSEKKLDELIHHTIEKNQMIHSLMKAASTHLMALEKKHLRILLRAWMTYEKTRHPFSVFEQEKVIQLNFSGLSLKLRFDRIDQLESGEQFLIDYKTTPASPSDWLSDPIQAPQLPAYLKGLVGLSGLAFGVVTMEKTALLGYRSEHLAETELKPLPNRMLQWHEQLSQWNTQINALASDFQKGISNPNPLKNAQTCRLCQHQSICRTIKS